MIAALLVDDEEMNLENLSFLLQNDCKDINVKGKVKNANEARMFLSENDIDVVFLDIQMPHENGFQFLESLPKRNFKVVFVTAFNQYALQAIKASALDYILKPINIDELKNTVEKIKLSLNNPVIKEQNHLLLENLLESFNKKTAPQKIALPQLGSIVFIELNDIVSLQADNNYTIIHMKDMQKKVITKTLKDFEDILDTALFARIHKSYIVNLRYIKEYSTIDGGIVKMLDGNQWSISRRQLDTFLEKMKDCSLMFKK